MSKTLFDKMNGMSVDEIIYETFQDETFGEVIDHPLSAEETARYFMQNEGVLTEEEFDTLMKNKLKALWEV